MRATRCNIKLRNRRASAEDLKGQLAYELKGPTSQDRTQCHGSKGTMGFAKAHEKHVQDKAKDCSTCHKCSRPERGLSTRIGG